MDKDVTSKKMQLETGPTHLSNSTMRGVLNKNGYHYLQTQRKGLLSKGDLECRKEFPRNMILYPESAKERHLLLFGW